jgi:hypothetical protein
MSDTELKTRVVADASGVAPGMAPGVRAVQDAARNMREAFQGARAGAADAFGSMREEITANVRAISGSMSGVVDVMATMRGGMVALAAVAAGVGLGKAASESAKMTEAAMDLARVMGTSTNVAQQWRIALEDVGATEAELAAAAKGMSRNLKENEDAMNAMGLVTRDAVGNLRPMNDLLSDGIGILGTYAQGADQAMAAKELFGRGVDASSKLLLVNNETLEAATQTMAGFGLEVGANAVAAWGEFDNATDTAGFALKGLGNTIGQIVMPLITDLVNVFNSVMPAAITVVKGALGGLATAFHAIKNGVVVVWETINAMVITVAEPIRALAEAIGRAVTGDFSGAAAAVTGIGDRIKGAWSQAMSQIAESSETTRNRIGAIWGGDSEAGKHIGPSGSKRVQATKEEDGKGSAKAEAKEREAAFMSFYEAMLSQEKLLAAQKDATREYSKEQERAYWNEILASYDVTGKDRLAISRKVAELEVQIAREQAKNIQAINADELKAKQQRGLDAVAAAADEAKGQYELGNISRQQLLDAERRFEERRMEIRRAYMQARLSEIDPERDPVQYNRTLLELEELERQHQARMGQIKLEMAKDNANNPLARTFESAEQAIATSIANIMARTQSMRQAMTAVWASVRSTVTGEIGKMLAAKAAAWARERLITMSGIGADAAKAGSGAAASQASIPYIGPMLALASMAAIMAAVGGLSSKVPSARGGWRVPSGVNPMTQLHEEEMVLPKEQAKVIDDMAEGRAGGGGQPFQVRTMPMGEWMSVHSADFAKLLRSLESNGAWRPAR